MQEHRSKDAKNAVVTPLMSHIATPSTLPHPGEPLLDEVRGLGSTDLDSKLKQAAQLEEVVALAAMSRRIGSGRESFEKLQPQLIKDLDLLGCC